MRKAYEIVHHNGYGGTEVKTGIKCLRCRRTSWNYNDVRNRFCSACNVFHEIISLVQKPDGSTVTDEEMVAYSPGVALEGLPSKFVYNLSTGCPDCGNKEFRAGQRARVMIHVQCTTCHSTFNCMLGVGCAERIAG